MSSLDYILIFMVCVFTILTTIKILSLQKFNNNYEILQKDKPNKSEMVDLLRQKLPTVITGEVEEWYIFDKNDKISEEKLNNQTLNENTSNLTYILPLVKKYNIMNYKKGHQTLLQTENNTRYFLVLLEGELKINLCNPIQKESVKKDNNLSTNKNLKFIQIKLHPEQILHIPFQWHFSFECLTNCKILEVNSETLLTLPYKIFNDKRK